MSTILNLDELLVNTIIKLGGETYEVPPIPYKLSRKFMNAKEGKNLDETDKFMFNLIAEYLNTNIDGKVVEVSTLEENLRARQLMALFNHIVDDIQNAEKK